jgi:hypothetical protein
MTETAQKKISGRAPTMERLGQKKFLSGRASTWAKPKKFAGGLSSESGQIRSNPVTESFTGGVNLSRAGQIRTFPDTPSPSPAKPGHCVRVVGGEWRVESEISQARTNPDISGHGTAKRIRHFP